MIQKVDIEAFIITKSRYEGANIFPRFYHFTLVMPFLKFNLHKMIHRKGKIWGFTLPNMNVKKTYVFRVLDDGDILPFI